MDILDAGGEYSQLFGPNEAAVPDFLNMYDLTLPNLHWLSRTMYDNHITLLRLCRHW